jgi:hypothetical protein
MRINNKTYAALNYLDEGVFIKNLQINEPDREFLSHRFKELTASFNDNIEFFKKEINYVSRAFYESAEKTSEKLLGLHNESEVKISFSGSFMINESVLMIHEQKDPSLSDFATLTIFSFTKEGILMSFRYNTKDRGYLDWVSLGIKPEYREDYNQNIWSSLIVLEFFKKFAQVETIMMPPGKKTRIQGTKYLNETKLNITHLDSKWFTTLVRSESFKVRGHFRLQPKKKDGEWRKELIWINDFVKDGYTSTAKILASS